MGSKKNIRHYRFILLAASLLLISISCKLVQTATPNPLPIVAPTSTRVPATVTSTSAITLGPPTASPTELVGDYVYSFDAGNFVGEMLIVKIEKAFCSYRPDVKGAPTFCNDQPFPNHTFTLITWGKDWTDLDGKCIFVEGEVEAYEGKHEIIAVSRDQILFCD